MVEKSDQPQSSPQPPYSFGTPVKSIYYFIDSALGEDSTLDGIYNSITPGLIEFLCSGINGTFLNHELLVSFHHYIWLIMFRKDAITLWSR